MIIRKAILSDAEQILYLEKSWESEDISWGLHIPRDRIDSLKKELKNQIWYVFENNNQLEGYIQGEIIKSDRVRPSFEIKKGEKYGELHAIYISKKFRGSHIGKKLIQILIKHFRKNKIRKIILKAVSKDTIGLVEYYKRFGFEERHVDMVKVLK